MLLKNSQLRVLKGFMIFIFLVASGCLTLYGYGLAKGTTEVTVHFNNPDGQPLNATWAAFQDGDRNWQVIKPKSQGVYQLKVTDPNGRYGFAYVHAIELPQVSLKKIEVLQATVKELPEVKIFAHFDIPTEGTFTVNGNLIGSRSNVTVHINGSGTEVAAGSKKYSVECLKGTWDVMASERDRESQGESEREYVTRLYIHRSLQVLRNTKHDINLSDASKTRSLEQKYILTVQGDVLEAAVDYITANKGFVNLARGNGQYARNLPYPSVPPELSKSGDLYLATVTGEGSSVLRVFSSPQNLTVNLPSPLTRVSLSGRTLKGMRYSGVQWWEIDGEFGKWNIFVTSGWLRGSDTYTIPDFSKLSGWNSEWNLAKVDEVSAVISNKGLQEGLLLHHGYPLSLGANARLDGFEIRSAFQAFN